MRLSSKFDARHPTFRHFKTSPEFLDLAVMLHTRFPLFLRNVEDLLHKRGIEVSHEAVRYWWNRFGPMFAAKIRFSVRAPRRWRWRWFGHCRFGLIASWTPRQVLDPNVAGSFGRFLHGLVNRDHAASLRSALHESWSHRFAG